jgi:heme-degrading monooxygenase HmoA
VSIEGDATGEGRFRTDQMMTTFRSRRRQGSDTAYSALAEEMAVAARAMPGFVDFKTFAAADGERVSIVTFDSAEHHDAWRDDPDHRAAQRRGQADWYAEYYFQVRSLIVERRFTSPEVATGPSAPG